MKIVESALFRVGFMQLWEEAKEQINATYQKYCLFPF